MEEHEFINVRIFSAIDNTLPSLSVNIPLDSIESIGIDRGDDDNAMTFSINLKDGNVFDTYVEDGMRVIERLREITAEKHKE